MASSARIDELRKKFDENPRRYFAPLANEYRKSGDLEQAIFICQEYLPQQPGHMSGHIVYGQALYELGRHEEARQVFETALSLDPENLIALRHLGDIARQSGDNKSARIWYQRVLEADPRNEEIAQIMMTLLATPDVAQPAVAANTATPLSTPAVPAPTLVIDSARATDPAGYRSVETGFQVERASDGSDLAVGPALDELPERQGTPVAPAPVVDEAVPEWKRPTAEEDLLDISDFSVGGVPLSEISTEPSVDEPPTEDESASSDEPTEEFTESASAFVADSSLNYERAETPSFSVPAAPESAVEDAAHADTSDAAIDLDAPFEADPFAIAAAPPVEEPATDITLGLPDDGTPAATFGDAQDDSLLGLETFEHGVQAPQSEASALEVESFFSSAPGAAEVSSDSLLEETSATERSLEPETPAETAAAEAWPVMEGGTDEAEAAEDFTLSETAGFAATPVASADAIEPPPVWSAAEPEPVFETPVMPMPVVPEPEPEPELETVAAAPTPALSVESEPEPEPEAFVTETMAELYLQQGHLEPALEIYQRLVEQRPDEPELVERMHLIEDTLHGRSSRSETAEVQPETAQAPARTGPTIRDFLSSLVATPTPLSTEAVPDSTQWQDEATPSMPVDAFAAESIIVEEPASIDEDFGPPAANASDLEIERYETPISSPRYTPPVSDAVTPLSVTPLSSPAVTPLSSAAVTPLSNAAVTPLSNAAITPVSSGIETPIVNPAVDASRATPAEPRRVSNRGLTPAAARETVSGSIDALFSGADASTNDSTAASTLAQAFAPEGPDTTPLQGMPAHKASSELSLDHVFKSSQSPRAEGDGDGFSFDQFFSDDLGDGATKSTRETPDAPKQGSDDIAQFNAWLNGLKKT